MNYEPMGGSYPRDLSDGRAAGLSAFMRNVYAWMGLGLAVTGLTAAFVLQDPTLFALVRQYNMVIGLVGLGVVMFTNAKLTTLKPAHAAALFLLYAASLGAGLSPLAVIYTSSSIANAFFISGGMFGGMAIYGYTTKRDLSGMTQFLMMGLIGGVIASLVNMFVHSEGLDFVINYAFVVVFTLMTAWDNQRLKHMYMAVGNSGNLAIFGALTLYLNFVNLFVTILRITGSRRDD